VTGNGTGLELCGTGEWLIEKAWQPDAPVVAEAASGCGCRHRPNRGCELTSKEVDDAAKVGPLLDQVAMPVASFTADGAYDQDRFYIDVSQ